MKIFYTLLLVNLLTDFASSQTDFQNIQLPRPKKAKYYYAQCEPSIAINQQNTNDLIAGSIINDYYFSKDAGKTWKASSLKSKYGVWGDPVMLFDKHGAAYYFHLAKYKKVFIDRIVCQKADSLNAKFSKGTFPKPNGKKAQDKHWVAYDSKKDVIYMTWTQFDKYGSKNPLDSSTIVFSKSNDGGLSWSDPKRISKFAGDCIDSDNTVEGAVPTVGPNGELYVCWTGPKGLCFQKSLNFGETWLEEEQILGKQVEGWDIEVPGIQRCNGLPIFSCDTSNSQYRGRLYLNWADQRNGKQNTDIFMKYSDDQGKTWSEPIKVNQDNSQKHQFFTWMAIDQTNGNLYFVYFDRRNYTDSKTDVYLSISKDGGKTFEDKRISESPFIPNEKIFFGDYNNIAVHNGIVRPIWPRMDGGRITLWTALIDLK
jgi:hypothetical protein